MPNLSSRKRYLLITLIPMIAIVLASALWAGQLASSVPDPMAVHFDEHFAADGFQTPMTNIVMLTGISLLIIVGFAVAARFGMWHGTTGRITAGATCFTVTLLAGLQIELFRIQQGLSDAAQATLPPSALGPALLVAIALGVVMGAVARPVPQSNAAPVEAKPSTISVSVGKVSDQETLVWQRSEAMHRGVRIIVSLATATALVFVVVMPNWATILTALVTLLAVATTWGWRFRIDAQGFSYRSYLGIPRATIPHHAIASAELIHVNAANWGGWGWRLNSSGTGLITQSGPGLRLTRTNGRIVEITSDDAATAVNVLQRYSPHRATDGK